MTSLADTLSHARAGDNYAFADLVRRFQDMAVGYAFALLGDHHLAEDAAQDAFLVCHQRLEQLREPAAFAAGSGPSFATPANSLEDGDPGTSRSTRLWLSPLVRPSSSRWSGTNADAMSRPKWVVCQPKSVTPSVSSTPAAARICRSRSFSASIR